MSDCRLQTTDFRGKNLHFFFTFYLLPFTLFFPLSWLNRQRRETIFIKAGKNNGLVLVELIVAVVIIGLFTMIAMLNMTGLVGRSSFERQADQLINILKMAYNSAATTGKRYEIVFDFAEQTYTLQNLILETDAAVLEDNVIHTGNFTKDFFLSYVQFDDYEATNEIAAKFRVSTDGFQYGGKIVILNSQGYPYTVMVNRIGGEIRVVPGDVDMIVPKDKDEIPF